MRPGPRLSAASCSALRHVYYCFKLTDRRSGFIPIGSSTDSRMTPAILLMEGNVKRQTLLDKVLHQFCCLAKHQKRALWFRR